MINKLEKEYIVPVSQCDHNAGLSFTGIFNIFMDLATEHAAILGIGNKDLEKDNLFWVAAKTRVCVKQRPLVMKKLTAVTWPEAPGNIRCNRYCTLADENGVVVCGKTEWTIVDGATGRPQKSRNIYPEGLVHLEDAVCNEPFVRICADFSDCEEIKKHLITSSDIDLSRHMNNVAYIRAVLSAFSCSELDKMDISEIEIAYKAQCFEGEELSIRKRQGDNCVEIGVLKSDGTVAATLIIR